MIKIYLFCLVLGTSLMGEALGEGERKNALSTATGTIEVRNHGLENYSQPGRYQVEEKLLDLKDAKRKRDVPVKLYFPVVKSSDEKITRFPLILFSHGLGGSRNGYEYLGKHWASHGYIGVHLQHIRSDESVWRSVGPLQRLEAMKKATLDPIEFVNRPRDVSFVLDQLQANPSLLPVSIHWKQIGMAGHSYGAHTTFAVGGQVYPLPKGRKLVLNDRRITAALALSPTPPKQKKDFKISYSEIKIPFFHMTGTKDQSPLDKKIDPAIRQIPYRQMEGSDQYLLVLKGGDHMVFSGIKNFPRRDASKDPRFHHLILTGSTAYWNAYLKKDSQAKRWLQEKYSQAVGKDGKFQVKIR